MTQALQVVLSIKSTIGAWHDVIDICAHYDLVLSCMYTERIYADRIASENHYAQ